MDFSIGKSIAYPRQKSKFLLQIFILGVDLPIILEQIHVLSTQHGLQVTSFFSTSEKSAPHKLHPF